MNERVLAIVTIIARHILADHELPGESRLVAELLTAGFDAEEIDAAFRWMEQLSLAPAQRLEPTFRPSTYRVFSCDERRLLSLEARGFLVRLRTLGLVAEEALEEIIQKAVMEADEEIGLPEIKSLAARILFVHAQSEWYREVESVLDDDWAGFLN